MSEDEKQQMCYRKIPFESREDALYSCAALYQKDGGVLHPYECPICRHWHVGNSRKLTKANRKNLRRKFRNLIAGGEQFTAKIESLNQRRHEIRKAAIREEKRFHQRAVSQWESEGGRLLKWR
jgi:hypothetical protein